MAIKLADLGKAVLETEYAVRGPIVAKAQELEKQGRDIIYCNIGNPQALEQKPLTWVRQVLALCEYPELAEKAAALFPLDAIEASRAIIKGSKFGLGAYSESKGVRFIREAVADFIHRRDGIATDPDAVYLTDGASKGVQAALRMLIASPHDGIMVPIPQYPLYSATITLYEGKQVNYYLDEHNDWKLSRQMLEESLAEAKRYEVKVKAIVIINPGNPTGSVLDKENIAMVIDFAKEHNLAILADEVYQENVYRQGDSFVSFAKVLEEKKEKTVSLFSFHSTSKGFLGECGHRGGYFEIRNIPVDVSAQILKLQSVSLCANLPGQVAVYCMVKPPVTGSPSHAAYVAERDGVLNQLKQRARLLQDGLNAIPGIRCNDVAGAMYAFPCVELPAGRTDNEYCMALLEATGICVVPGTGFGQIPGTAHFRTTILPPTAKMEEVIKRIAEFQKTYH
ncbi:MAG: aminotransferase class I/II [Spirochaetes bacterium GWD1_61_31]|nr:MAG: aminotransferase class I/II [Spirochaetes bacterium GWB1_60_80]OHD32382.1 MAG: aminotransferase class I/II [Spirochaetes bacterium GWC1_61_12]OHD38064.1 MAG: aminotransferase class I/II [Spirochaetes bacterium GWD1_61_31]OHD44550.1 MAG: aminotransferase class I/II [Spirochaetes bacterium GWE1_60_18]OHD58662.1 MAG: aminotransferase class I/II [Spirochaetes bacterium GWF1_60_12]HAP43207.1 aminotransferase class I/II [Spirochaetaceae bacterium]